MLIEKSALITYENFLVMRILHKKQELSDAKMK